MKGLGVRETTPLIERTYTCANDEVLDSVRIRRLNQMTKHIARVFRSLTDEDRKLYGKELPDIGMVMCHEQDWLTALSNN